MASSFAHTESGPVGADTPGSRPALPATDESALRNPAGRPILVTGGAVLTVDPAVGDFPVGDVLIQGPRILAVGADLRERAGEDAIVVDATDMIVIPGFVDSHVHAWEGQLRGVAPVLDFAGYLGVTAFGYGPHYLPHDNYVGTLATALVALDGGITTMVDNSHNSHTVDHSRAAVEALRDAGIRGVHAVGQPLGTEPAHWPDVAGTLRDEYGSDTLDVRLFEIYASVPLWRYALEREFWISSEVGTHVPEVDDLLAELAEQGLFTAQRALNHCYDVSDASWELIRDSGAAVNLCPRSDPAYGLGSAELPLAKALRHGIVPGLSGDNEISYGLDMFTEMRTLHTRYRAGLFGAAAHGAATDTDAATDGHLAAGDLLRFATMGGAANAGLADRIGSLTPGKQADLVLVRTADVNTFPGSDPVTTVTAFAHSGNVDTVFVGGLVRKRRGQLVSADLATVRERVIASRDRLVAASERPIERTPSA